MLVRVIIDLNLEKKNSDLPVVIKIKKIPAQCLNK